MSILRNDHVTLSNLGVKSHLIKHPNGSTQRHTGAWGVPDLGAEATPSPHINENEKHEMNLQGSLKNKNKYKYMDPGGWGKGECIGLVELIRILLELNRKLLSGVEIRLNF